MFKLKTWLAIFAIMTILAVILNVATALYLKSTPIRSYICGLLNGATLLELFVLYDRK